MAWNGKPLRVAPTLAHAHDVALGMARVAGVDHYAIEHVQGSGGALFVACLDPEGSGLPVVNRLTVTMASLPMVPPIAESAA